MDRRRRLSFALAVLVGGAMTACSEVSSAPQEIKREPIAVVVEAVTEVTEPITVRRSAAIRTRVDVVLVKGLLADLEARAQEL